MEQPKQTNEVTNLNQAIGVLMQAAEKGRSAGIFQWEELEILSNTLKFLNAASAEQEKLATAAATSVDQDMPQQETKEVILEPTKD